MSIEFIRRRSEHDHPSGSGVRIWKRPKMQRRRQIDSGRNLVSLPIPWGRNGCTCGGMSSFFGKIPWLGAPTKHRSRLPSCRGVYPVFLSGHSQLVERSRLYLPHPLLGNPHTLADLLECRRFLGVIEPEPVNDNLLLPVVKATEYLPNRRNAIFVFQLFAHPIGTRLFGSGKQLVVARAKTLTLLHFVRYRSSEVLHDRPTGVSTESESTREIEFVGGSY